MPKCEPRKHSKGLKWKHLEKYNIVLDSECYETFQEEIKGKYQIENAEKVFQLPELLSAVQAVNIPFHHHIMQKGFFIVRRNLSAVPLKPQMYKKHYLQVQKMFEHFVADINRKSPGFVHHSGSDSYNLEITNIMKECNISTDYQQIKLHQFCEDLYPLGTSFYRSYCQQLCIACNLEDHFILVQKITQNNISFAF